MIVQLRRPAEGAVSAAEAAVSMVSSAAVTELQILPPPHPHAAENSIRDLRPSLVPSLPGSTCVNHFTTLRHPADNSNHHHHLTPTRPTDFLLSITAITAHSGHAPEVHFSHPETPESSIKQQYRLLPWLRRYAHSLAVSCFHLLWRYIIIFRFFFLLY